MSLLEKSLIVLLILVTVLASYFYTKSRRQAGTSDQIDPLDSGLVSWFALLFVFVIFCAFIYFGENKYNVPENIGQIGDFIGGLTNPVLSFLALLVLLRTTSIQTGEARKTTMFMEKQQNILEKEKFENTFFQLLAQLESYCDRHLRVEIDGISGGLVLSRKLRSKLVELNKLDSVKQVDQAKSHIKEVTSSTECTMLYHRTMRVVRYIDRSPLPVGFRRSYASVIRDTIYPAECVIVSSLAYQFENDREILKEWNIVNLNKGAFVCSEIENYYRGKP